MSSIDHHRIVLALDGLSKSQCLDITSRVKDHIWGVKVNDAFVRDGPTLIHDLALIGKPIFLDGKYHDTPGTMQRILVAMKELPIDMVSVHIEPGIEYFPPDFTNIRLVGITVLSSTGDKGFYQWYQMLLIDEVIKKAHQAVDGKFWGIVCATPDVGRLRRFPKLQSIVKIATGVRPSWDEVRHDHVRAGTPSDAIENGADLLVMGRPILQHENPVEACQLINEEVRGVEDSLRPVEL